MATQLGQQIPAEANDDAYSSDDSFDQNDLQDDADFKRYIVTESALNRWGRFPAEEKR